MRDCDVCDVILVYFLSPTFILLSHSGATIYAVSYLHSVPGTILHSLWPQKNYSTNFKISKTSALLAIILYNAVPLLVVHRMFW